MQGCQVAKKGRRIGLFAQAARALVIGMYVCMLVSVSADKQDGFAGFV